jgi:hypothetical protein
MSLVIVTMVRAVVLVMLIVQLISAHLMVTDTVDIFGFTLHEVTN